MSELIQINYSERNLLRLLFGTASAIALIATSVEASADDGATQPILWIELGGQWQRLDSSEDVFTPPFFSGAKPEILAPLTGVQKQPAFSIGEEAKIIFEPEDSNWMFSVTARYGRGNLASHLHYQTKHTTQQTVLGRQISAAGRPLHEFGDGRGNSSESHLTLDFQAGKDVGLGLFGEQGNSVVSAGVRFAQLSSSSHTTLLARPFYRSGPFIKASQISVHGAYFQNNNAVIQAKRSAVAVGPMLSWDASAPFMVNGSTMSVAFDWGANAAILFGRQKARLHHQTTSAQLYEYPGSNYPYERPGGYVHGPYNPVRSHTVTIPNVGGFAGVSFKYADAKLALGYRADFFFNAMDGGIDKRKSENVGFYGPFASVGIGL